VANGRWKKNFITSMKHEGMGQEEKQVAFDAAYASLIGEIGGSDFTVDLINLGLLPRNLDDLDCLFTKEEVWRVIQDLPLDHALGPNRFIGLFYQKAWGIIKRDVMEALLKLAVGDGRGFGKLNRSLITPIPKKPDVVEIDEF
jgi:hypothetical protein